MNTPVRPRKKRHPHDDAPDTSRQFRRIAELPNCPEREALYKDVICAWIPMADRLARTFRDRGEALEDLEQVAALGLVKAVHRYDPDRGRPFESYAVPTIVGEVKRHFRDHMWGLHVPRRTQELRNRVRASARQLSFRLDDRGPSVAQLAEHSGLTEDEVRTGLEALDSYSTLSLNAELPGADGDYSLLDTLGTVEPGFDRVVDREAVRHPLASLPERERHILYLRYFHGMTQSRIAEQLGISQMHVSRLLNRACERVRAEIEGGESGGPPAGTERPAPAERRRGERQPVELPG
ncbi:SigB/SigF/SigG family RNA polymerase sigma factor [Streptomyces sp. DSM 44915]|uniref:SigB/SigF/SigG family RNA polymerase sigma factor n=1 Tax=Streptomyces chisholmiae TaxID=3075540 RepID=A0ABU2JP09_9ACTN|nr:SigB/SigF/SigG family RNA polymerase sigma factor [Streptomyces sp. DSM 44915]MDT0266458.1 SigB/SigF/SigG family RNA polymerase sigma factor [Streptomyces sp. DSM 44915]